jgi:hypothetical protein
MIAERAIQALRKLRNAVFLLFIPVFLASLFQSLFAMLLSPVEYIRPGGDLYPLPMIVTLSVLLPVILAYISAGRDWLWEAQSATYRLLSITFYQGTGVSIGYYILIGLASYLIAVMACIVFVDPNIISLITSTNYFSNTADKILRLLINSSLLYTGFYTIVLAVLIDIYIAGRRTIRLINRIFDGVIVGIVIGIAQLARSLFVTQFAHHEAQPGDLSMPFEIAFVSIVVVFGFAIGAFVPMTASRNLLQAKSILDQCSTNVRKLG